MNNTVCAVIVSYNAPDELNKCIISALPQLGEIIVVDNNSEITLKEIITNTAYPSKVKFVFNNTNRGLGDAFNQGIEYSLTHSYEWTLLLDQDSVLSENMIDQLICAYNKLGTRDKEKVALLVPRIYDRNFNAELPGIITGRIFNKKLNNPLGDTFIHFQISSGSLVKNKKMKSIGLLNDQLFIDYIDYDYCFRILESGNKIFQSKDACLYHSLGELNQRFFIKYREHSPQRVYYQTRNRLFIIFNYGQKFRSVRNAEIFRMFLKILKIIFLESNKLIKLKMYLRGVIDFTRKYRSFHI